MRNLNPANALPALIYQKQVIGAKNEMLSLTDMWRAAGSDENRNPFEWQRKEGSEFVKFFAEMHNTPNSRIIDTKRGKGGGTFAHWQIALAYAKYLSPEFHMWCNSVVRERMEGKSVSVASLPDDVLDMIRRTDGISRMLSHKITVMEGTVSAIERRDRELMLLADPRRAALDVVSVRQLLEDARALQKTRTGLNRRLGCALRNQAAQTDGCAAWKCPHTGVWLFKRDLAMTFMKQFGNAMVKAHNDKISGQGVLKLVVKSKISDELSL